MTENIREKHFYTLLSCEQLESLVCTFDGYKFSFDQKRYVILICVYVIFLGCFLLYFIDWNLLRKKSTKH